MSPSARSDQALGATSQFAEFDARLIRSDKPDAPVNVEATAQLRITVKDPDPERVGRSFSGAATELALAGYPGLHLSSPPAEGSVYGVYWPALVPAGLVLPEVVHPDGRRVAVPHTANRCECTGPTAVGSVTDNRLGVGRIAAAHSDPGLDRPCRHPSRRRPRRRPVRLRPQPTRRLPLGTIIGARSGDKGGNANVGLWARSDEAWAVARRLHDHRDVPHPAPRGGRARDRPVRLPQSARPQFRGGGAARRRGGQLRPGPIHRPRDWASTFGAGWSTFRSAPADAERQPAEADPREGEE